LIYSATEFYNNHKLKEYGFPIQIYSKVSLNTNEGEIKMSKTIREESEEYESKETKNISDLKKVFTEAPIEKREYTDKNGDQFEINIIEVDGEEYRVPNSVLKQLKTIIKEKPDMTVFRVAKSGNGMKTQYQVIPMD
jgi:hypothetical protein